MFYLADTTAYSRSDWRPPTPDDDGLHEISAELILGWRYRSAFWVLRQPLLALLPTSADAPAKPNRTVRRSTFTTVLRGGCKFLGLSSTIRTVHSPRRIGSVKVNVEPTPTSLFTQIRPPCSSTNFRHSVSPSPVPSTFLSAVPTCRNSSNTAS
jgi:hypothetical protein